MVNTLFFISLTAICYTYLLYPALLFVLASLVQCKRDVNYVFTKKDRRGGEAGHMPSVSILVSAYNEEQVIEEKILNSLALDYPDGLLEVIIASDGSTDRTNTIVQSYADQGVRLLDFKERGGKASVLNRTVPESNGEILVFSDANTFFQRDALKKLVRHFSSPGVGGTCGEMRLTQPEGGTNEYENSYWHLENVLKFLENRIGATLGANGGMYALKREAFEPIPPDTVIDDFLIFMRVREKGLKTVFDPEAIAYEEVTPSIEGEFKRKVRIGAGNIQSIGQLLKLLSPLEGVVSFSFWSHKILRWLVPIFMVVILATNILLLGEGNLYIITFAIQVVCYLLAILGLLLKSGGPLVNIPYYFVSINLALSYGFIKYLLGKQSAAWDRTQR
jgi:cellulose synthase/poly-beta-1,6-N-acetylglucosamine synthase-like glycosyltransferase